MRRSDEFYTFCDVPVETVLSKRLEEATSAVKRIPEAAIKTANEAAIVDQLTKKHAFIVPNLDFDSISVEAEARMVPGSYFPRTFFTEPHKKYEKKAYIFRLPFSGDPIFLRCYESSRTLSPKRAYLDNEALCFEFVDIRGDKDEITTFRDATLQHFRRYLPSVAARKTMIFFQALGHQFGEARP